VTDVALPAPSRLQQLRSRGRLREAFAVLGPAFVACIAYVDPGNFATNIAGGAKYGYLLLWVLLSANLMAMLIQNLSAKIGIATGHNLPELCREHFPRPVSWGLWVQAELIAMATDLAEFVGAAIALNLLFGVPLFPAGVITAVIAFGILALQQMGYRRFEAVIAGLLGLIVLGFLYDTLKIGFDAGQAAKGFIPGFAGTDSILLATGILGATVMPHVIYLHSALTQGRIPADDDDERRRLLRFQRIDVTSRWASPAWSTSRCWSSPPRSSTATGCWVWTRSRKPTASSGRWSAAARRWPSPARCWRRAWRRRAWAPTPARW